VPSLGNLLTGICVNLIGVRQTLAINAVSAIVAVMVIQRGWRR
jgi:hypothetical protein